MKGPSFGNAAAKLPYGLPRVCSNSKEGFNSGGSLLLPFVVLCGSEVVSGKAVIFRHWPAPGKVSFDFAAATGKGEAFHSMVTVINKATTPALHFTACDEKGMRQGRSPKLPCDLSLLLSGCRMWKHSARLFGDNDQQYNTFVALCGSEAVSGNNRHGFSWR